MLKENQIYIYIWQEILLVGILLRLVDSKDTFSLNVHVQIGGMCACEIPSVTICYH